MKTNFLLIIFMFTCSFSNAQVGIGTTDPAPSAVLDLTSTDQALLLPRLANTSEVLNPVNGMLVYDISSSCVKAFENNNWTDCLSSFSLQNAIIADCDSNGLNGSYLVGNELSATSHFFTVTITNNVLADVTLDFAISDLILSGDGAAGITVDAVSPSTVTLNPGSVQNITYSFSGTPSAIGQLDVAWSKLSLSCSSSTMVTSPPSSIRDALSDSQAAYSAAPTNTLVEITQEEYENLKSIVPESDTFGAQDLTSLSLVGGYRYAVTDGSDPATFKPMDANSYVVAVAYNVSYESTGHFNVVGIASPWIQNPQPRACLTSDTPDDTFSEGLHYFAVKSPQNHCGNKRYIGIVPAQGSDGLPNGRINSAGSTARTYSTPLVYVIANESCEDRFRTYNNSVMQLGVQVITTTNKTW